MNVLFIGNSYTFYNDMPALFQALAAENGHAVTAYSVTAGGRRLERYLNPEDPVTAKLDDILRKQDFDVCFIQEQSLLPATDHDRFIAGLDCVIGKVRKRAKRLILYVSWGRKSGNKDLAAYNWTPEIMTRLLADSYEKAAQIYGIEQSVVGAPFLQITQNHPEIDLYDPDLTHPSYVGSCLIALIHYRTVFGHFPTHTASLALTESQLAVFKSFLCT